MHNTLVVTILPFLGATISLLPWPRPRVVKAAALLVAGVTVIGLASGAVTGSDPTATALMTFIALTAFVAVLGQQLTRQAPLSIVVALIILGLSLAALASSQPVGHMFLGSIMGTIALLLLWRAIGPPDALTWGAVAGLGVGILALAASAVVSGSFAAVLQLVACATLLPLFPLQAAFVGSLSNLPGTLPAFLAVVLPCLGWHSIVSLTSEVPVPLIHTVIALALVGALYEAVRASVQFHLARIIASITTILFSLVWWYVGATGKAAPEAGWYLSTVSLAASGLLLAWHQLEARYGFLDLDKLRGLARPMPRFATLVGLLLMAAMGLPLFGVFSTFMAMMVASPSTMLQSTVIVFLIWLIASLLLMRLLQRLLCGHPKPDVVYQDSTLTELLPLVLVLFLLAPGVRAPVHLFQPAAQAHVTVVAEGTP